MRVREKLRHGVAQRGGVGARGPQRARLLRAHCVVDHPIRESVQRRQGQRDAEQLEEQVGRRDLQRLLLFADRRQAGGAACADVSAQNERQPCLRRQHALLRYRDDHACRGGGGLDELSAVRFFHFSGR